MNKMLRSAAGRGGGGGTWRKPEAQRSHGTRELFNSAGAPLARQSSPLSVNATHPAVAEQNSQQAAADAHELVCARSSFAWSPTPGSGVQLGSGAVATPWHSASSASMELAGTAGLTLRGRGALVVVMAVVVTTVAMAARLAVRHAAPA